MAGGARHDPEERGREWFGRQGWVGRSKVWAGAVGQGRRGKARFGLEGTSEVWQAWID
jgi:hypothetical protein